MQELASRVLTTIVSACFAALALSAATVSTANAQDKTVTKQYCKEHPTDPRCKDMNKE